MAKKQIEVLLKTGEETLKLNVSALIIDNIIKYRDNDVLVSIELSDDYVVMKRENNEYQLILKFKYNEKLFGSYLLKDNNICFDLEILTKSLNIEKNYVSIIYELNDEIREYKLYIKE